MSAETEIQRTTASAFLVEPEPDRNALWHFFLILFSLAGVSLLLAFLPVPPRILPLLVIVVSALFIAAPVAAIFRAAAFRWTSGLAVGFIVLGVAMHVGLSYAGASLAKGALASVLSALGQSGLMVWCVGLGALLTTLLKEKNLLIPVSLFLAAFDIFLVLTPVGPTRIILQAAPQVFETASWHIPKVQENPTLGPVAATAHIGPADFLFMAMFFVAIHRFGMRSRQTLLWLAPTLLAYMVIVGLVGPLPALVPIGLCVLIVNWKEFSLSKEEWASTALVAVLCAGLIGWGATRPKPQVEILPPENAQESQVPEGSPGPTSP